MMNKIYHKYSKVVNILSILHTVRLHKILLLIIVDGTNLQIMIEASTVHTHT